MVRRCRSGDVAGHGGHVPPRVPGGRRGAPRPPSNRHQLTPRPYRLGRVAPLPRPSARTRAEHRMRATARRVREPRSIGAREERSLAPLPPRPSAPPPPRLAVGRRGALQEGKASAIMCSYNAESYGYGIYGNGTQGGAASLAPSARPPAARCAASVWRVVRSGFRRGSPCIENAVFGAGRWTQPIAAYLRPTAC